MDTIERLRAEEVIRDSRLAEIWRSVGAEVRQVGSLRSGLLMKHRDIDFHIYSSPLRLEESFAAMAQLAADPAVGRIECRNLLATDEACVEWHATYRDRDGDEWQLDMIHIVRGSRYDGYFERVADRIAACKTYQGSAYTDASALGYLERSNEARLMHPDTVRALRFLLTKLRDEGERAAFCYIKTCLRKNVPFCGQETQSGTIVGI